MRVNGGVMGMMLAFAASTSVQAEPAVNYHYSVGGGGSSNIFQDTTALSAGYGETRLGLRGTLELEDSGFDYAISASGRRVPRYRFADQQTIGVESGYRRDLAGGVSLTLKGGLEYRRSGDVFLALPGALIGYRKTDVAHAASAGLSVEGGGGKSHFTAAFSGLDRHRARFTLAALRPTQLEADENLLDMTAGHIRPLLGGEIGATVQYRASLIASGERERHDRFPAQALRGSLAYGRQIGDSLTLLGEIGVVNVDSDYLGKSVRRMRPFLKAEATWRPREGLALTARFGEDTRFSDLDDALGEHVRSAGLSIETALTDRLKAGLAFEQADSDWLYYAYGTHTRTLAATLTLGLDDRHALLLEYSRLMRRESDRAADFRSDALTARIAGAF